MADYYSILNKTVSALPNNTAQTRQLVYSKARTAIEKQLRAIEPSPGEAAIARQFELLEEAINRLEDEQASAETAPAAAPPEPQSPVHATAAPSAPDPVPGPAPIAAPAPPQPSPPVAEQPVAPEGDAPTQSPVSPPPASPPPASPPPASQPAEPGMAPMPQMPAQQPDTAAPLQNDIEEAGPPASDVPPVPPPPAYDTSLDALLDEADRGGESPAGASREAKQAKGSSRLAGIVLSLVLVGAIGLGGYLLWRNKDALMALVGGEPAVQSTQPAADDGDGQTDEEPATAEDTQAASEESKEEARLGADGDEIAPEPRVITPEEPASGEPAPAGETTADGEAQSGEPATQEAEVSPVDEEPVGEQAVVEGESADNAAVPAVAQTAYLYEEGSSASAATRDNAAVIWTLEQVSPAIGAPAEAVIVGKLDVPGRGLTMNMRIRRNVDDSLPASHLIELEFATPPDFAGGNVDTLARFVMKASEQSRGEPLVAVPARVMPGNFIIALNNLESARQSNERLMLESNWIDIPLGYASGRRALVTLEKGAIGQQVFRDAFADWQSP